jgi:hypothetical protein
VAHATLGKFRTKYTYRDYKTDENGNVTSEKLVYFKSTGKDRLLYQQAVSEPLVDKTLSVYGHGNVHNFNYNTSVTDVDALLMNDSVMYNNFVANGGNLTLNLKSCNTGNYSQGGNRTISEDLTQMRAKLIIHAAVSLWKYNGSIQDNMGYNMFINGAKVGWNPKL